MSGLEQRFNKSWINAIGEDKLLSILLDINIQLKEQRLVHDILPKAGDPLMFKAFRLTPLTSVKVVILGIDPYHDGSFNGVSFGNGTNYQPVEKISPSLRNIMKELDRCYEGLPHPSLYAWAEQGVLLINTAHTVIRGESGAHLDMWAPFTIEILDTLYKQNTKIVWMLWGAQAANYEKFITNPLHCIIKTGHPSPLNRSNPFVGSDCFIECDGLLGKDKIVWGAPF